MSTSFGHGGWIWLLALAVLLGIALYWRGRRMIGRQRYQENRILLRVGLIAALTIIAVIPLFRQPHVAEAVGAASAGFVVGIVIAVAALRFTLMGRNEAGVWYVPNLYLGIGLIALLVARFAYEYVVLLPQVRRQMAAAAQGVTPHAVTVGPMLHGVLFLVLGYYFCYYAGVILRARRLPEAAAPSAAEGTGQ